MGYRLADALVGVSQGVADDMATLANLGRGRVSVIGNPVPPPREPSEEALRQVDSLWGVPRGSRILSVGRLKPVKNHALLLQALVHCKRPNARIMLVGSGECEAALRALTIRLGLNDRIIFAGFQPDPSPFYRTADVLAVSSNHEGFGNVIVEALACGVPVVSTDCPSGPSEILANGQFGFLVPVDHAKLMAEAFEHVLGQPKDPDRLKTRAGLYAPKYAAEQYLSLLNLR
jgi:glycosyltransferase involved in cell wall biosynthesis